MWKVSLSFLVYLVVSSDSEKPTSTINKANATPFLPKLLLLQFSVVEAV